MLFLLHFLLAHFLADYPLQSTRLVHLKWKSFFGVFIHGSIHLMVMMIILFPLLHSPKVWVALGIIYVTHNIIDQTKVKLDKSNPGKARLLYFLDQFLHWSIILAMAFYVNGVVPNLSEKWMDLYMNHSLFLYLLALIGVTYFYDVSRYFLLLKMKDGPYQRDYRTMFLNALVLTAGFSFYWVYG